MEGFVGSRQDRSFLKIINSFNRSGKMEEDITEQRYSRGAASLLLSLICRLMSTKRMHSSHRQSVRRSQLLLHHGWTGSKLLSYDGRQ